MQKLFEKRELEKQGYSVSIKGFITILEPKNLTEQTSGIITFKRTICGNSTLWQIVGEKF